AQEATIETLGSAPARHALDAGYKAPPARRTQPMSLPTTPAAKEQGPDAPAPALTEKDLLNELQERTAGVPLERFHIAACVAAFFFILGGAIMAHGASAHGIFDGYFEAGLLSFAAA